MKLGLILETHDPERVWNGLRLGITALEEDHDVEVFLLGDGVEAADLEHVKFNPRGLLRKLLKEGGTCQACGTCLDSRDLEPGELRPRATMKDLLRIVETSDRVVTIG